METEYISRSDAALERIVELEEENALLKSHIEKNVIHKEKALLEFKDKNNFWLNVLNNVPMSVYVKDNDKFVWSNNCLKETLGILGDSDDVNEQAETYFSRIHAEDREKIDKKTSDEIALGSNAPSAPLEFRIRAANDEWIWLYSLGKPVDYDFEGRLNLKIGAAIDITERKNLEQENARLHADLHQSNQILEWKNKILQKELSEKKNSLIRMTLTEAEKNHTFAKFKEQLLHIPFDPEMKKEIEKITNTFDARLEYERTWQIFENHFNEIYPNFYNSLLNHHRDLSISELKICMMLKFDLKTKDIASILNISARTVEHHRLSIRKKFGLNNAEQLSVYLAK